MAAMEKFSWDRQLVINVLKDTINRNRESRNHAVNKALALAGQPNRRGRPPKRQLEEAQKPIVLPKIPPRAPLPTAHDTHPRPSTPARDMDRPETPVFVGGAVSRRNDQPPIATGGAVSRCNDQPPIATGGAVSKRNDQPPIAAGGAVLRHNDKPPIPTHKTAKLGKLPNNKKFEFDYSFSIAGHVIDVKFALSFQRWLDIVDELVAKYDPDNNVADDEAGYIYYLPSAFGKREVRIARDDQEQYSVFLTRAKNHEVLMGDEGVISLQEVGFPRGRSASAGPSLPLAAVGTGTTRPSHRKRTHNTSTPETPYLPQAKLGAKRQRKDSPLVNLRQGRSSGKPELEKLPEPRNPKKAKAALSKRQKDTHEKRVAKLRGREV